ncbi:unnamed protein product [Brassica rapa subsp. trilocularis]
MVYNSFELPESLFSFLWMFHLMLIWPASNISTFYRLGFHAKNLQLQQLFTV